MTQDENKNSNDKSKQKKGSSFLGPILAVIFLGALLFRFIFQLSEDGWDVASKQNGLGSLVFILACILAYIVSAELIYVRFSKSLGKLMGWLFVLCVAFFIFDMSSCSKSNDRKPTDNYYRP